MNRDGQRLTVDTQIKVCARRVHALVTDTSDRLSTSDSVADGAMTNLVSGGGQSSLSGRR
jgi:hypothetical protein